MRKIAVNDKGLRIGQDHQRALFTDHEIEMMRTLHEEPHRWGYGRIADKFGASKSYVRDVCKYRVRAQSMGGCTYVEG